MISGSTGVDAPPVLCLYALPQDPAIARHALAACGPESTVRRGFMKRPTDAMATPVEHEPMQTGERHLAIGGLNAARSSQAETAL